jgi:protein-S-isoprenylcysteine O-methyltransferase Ste14
MTQPSSRSRTALVATTVASALVVPGGLTVAVPYLLATRLDVRGRSRGATVVAASPALLLLAFHRFVTAYEEPRLRRRFGASYDGYCSRVPRCLPGFAGAAEQRS